MPALPTPALPRPVVLYVEDEVLIREMLVEALEDGGYRALTAGDSGGALQLLEQHEALAIVGLSPTSLSDRLWTAGRSPARGETG
jgi:CheY-like chemotaxis protein